MRFGSAFLLPLALLLSGSMWHAAFDPRGPILARAIPLDLDAPGSIRVGRLRYLGGWRLRSSNLKFGGISSMVADDAGRFLAIGDRGALFRFDAPRDGAAGNVEIRPLPGNDPSNNRLNDTESLAVDPATGTVWIGYENRNRIRRFDAGVTRVLADVHPAPMARWPLNGGPEAMTRLADGRFVVLSENAIRGDGTRAGVLFSGDPTLPGTTSLSFSYRGPAPGYRPTDLRQLPDGRLLVLHRRVTLSDGLSAVLAIVDTDRIREGAIVAGDPIGWLRRPLTIDNMEALAVTREQGRTILWIASDDNFLMLQQTLLLKFALEE